MKYLLQVYTELLPKASIRFLLLSTIFVQTTRAQIKDSLDNLVFAVNNDWRLSHSESYKQFTFYGKDKSFCQLTVYKAQPSSGNKTTDFQTEWKELVEKNFSVFTLASPMLKKSSKGIPYQRLGAKAVGSDGNKYYVQLNVFDCGNSIQSVVAVSGTQKQLQGYDSAWQKLITGIKKNTATTSAIVNTQSVPPTDKTIVGSWHKSASSPSAYTNGVVTNLAYSGYTKGEYNFQTDGSYTFQGESWGGYMNSTEYRLIDEKGSFTVTGNTLQLTPSKSLYRVVDEEGILKSSQNLPLDKRTYTWKTHYYEGLNETSLILTATKENAIDGGFSQTSLFPNSFIYDPGKKLEFRFLPHKF